MLYGILYLVLVNLLMTEQLRHLRNFSFSSSSTGNQSHSSHRVGPLWPTNSHPDKKLMVNYIFPSSYTSSRNYISDTFCIYNFHGGRYDCRNYAPPPHIRIEGDSHWILRTPIHSTSCHLQRMICSFPHLSHLYPSSILFAIAQYTFARFNS